MKAQGLTKETILDYGIKERGFPPFRVGDAVEVSQIVKEGDKERIQKFAGDVISIRHGGGINKTFTVRRIGANNIGVERIFPYHSEIIDAIRLIKHGRVRKAKLFYIRKRVGKSARIQELFLSREDKEEASLPRTTTSKQPHTIAAV
jgi:large subunit ribosomal protein L19